MPTPPPDPNLVARAIGAAARRRVSAALARLSRADRWLAPNLARAELLRLEPLLARALTDAQLLEYLEAARRIAEGTVPEADAAEAPEPADAPPEPPAREADPGEPAPLVRYPQIERAAADLMARNVMLPGDFDKLTEEAKRNAFTVTRATTLDAVERVREAVHQHRAQAGSVVVLDIKSGEILALTNYPSYIPGKRGGLSGAQLRNRALTDTFEPGSTMKPLVIGLALEKGVVKPETMIQTAPGRLQMGTATITDSHPHGMLSVNEVIQKSSNVGTVKIAMQMQPHDMWEVFTQVGLGQKPQVPFPGAVAGKVRAYKTWRPIEQATMSYGYGLSASLFQLAQAYSVFARDGELVPMSLIKTQQNVTGARVFSVQNATAVRHMLHMVTSPGGTAMKAQTMGYSVGGKTGTAHKVEGKGYAGKKYRGFFVGIAPIDNPRIVVAVMVDEPTNGAYFGGDVAAPVFSQTVQQTLRMMGVQPDMAVKPQVVTKVEKESF